MLIAGAGIAALEALLALRELAGDRVEVDLLAPSPDFVYRPLTVLEPFERGEAQRLSLGGIVRSHGAGHVFDGLAAVEPEHRRVRATSGSEYDYDALVVATGARAVEGVPGALTFPGQGSVGAFRTLLGELERGECKDVVFTLPAQTGWALPLYELALLTAAWLFERRISAELAVATPEKGPLTAFGERASATVADLLERHGVRVYNDAAPRRVHDGALELAEGWNLHAERVVALPRLIGPDLPGLPAAEDGFIPVDEHGRVEGLDSVYAAGDVTALPIKQGGLAAQQGDAVAEALAEWAGAPVRPTPFRPVLQGVLLSGEDPAYLRHDTHGHRRRSLAQLKPMWWPPAKVAGDRLAPYLASRGIALPAHPSAGEPAA